MNRIVVKSRVGEDGVLHLDVPLGTAEANREVQVTVEASNLPMTQAEWQAFIESTAGSIADPSFGRPPQLSLEEREPLP